ncbi:methylated-DNA--[protein]-cysteine S-methyltransferase [Nanchangia anserum]|uniref:methylated-DNA--[protein]-cysteine S-methyltransferase n=1 Tax=Nanchangia anserum TaxID=2692125 RepID=A0A8I0G6J0_9ACTO|nr:methylated-DNA--[protein]-cysteine S-methyltransferase [Nanchangia anserum]MBD3688712.1 methylated-DNA--[protein]-cysteine S-methyltransferase [Nanchangia anserum]QOX82459.1 methylated-DNA--[protein]-cysteine S-methyltransferase [Nanchangia anserum]
MDPTDKFPRRRYITVTPFGALFLVGQGRYLERCRFEQAGGTGEDVKLWAHPADPLIEKITAQVGEYVAGTRTEFDLDVRVEEGPPFAQRVWQKVSQIPYGHTVTYGQLAASLGNRHRARAVGQAVRANPLHLIIPCHRVVASNGRLGGYVAGSETKRALLEHEALHRPDREWDVSEGQRALF